MSSKFQLLVGQLLVAYLKPGSFSMVRTVGGLIIMYGSYFFYLLAGYVVMWCVVLGRQRASREGNYTHGSKEDCKRTD